MIDPTALLPEVIALTEPYLDRGFLALYVHGSYVTGEMDHWSDLDLCAIRHEGPPEALREWSVELERRFGHLIDPLAAPVEQLGADGHWSLAFVRCVLSTSSELILGKDLRDKVASPTPHLVRLTAANTGLIWLRRLCGLNRLQHLPERVDDLQAQPLPDWLHGNDACQAVMATLQLLRALVETRTGEFNCSRSRLAQAVADHAPDLHPWALRALEARRQYPRTGEVDGPDLRELFHNVPTLGQRLLDQLTELRMPDPTYEGIDGSHYHHDGTLKEHKT